MDRFQIDNALARWRGAFQDLILSFGSGLRHTQDGPVLADVWLAYAEGLSQARAPLILVPHYRATPGAIIAALAATMPGWAGEGGDGEDGRWESLARAGADPGGAADGGPASLRVRALSNDVLARLSLEEMVRHVLPMTDWWTDMRGGEDGGVDAVRTAQAEIRRAAEAGFDQATLVALYRHSEHKPLWRLFAIVSLLAIADWIDDRFWRGRRAASDKALSLLTRDMPEGLSGAALSHFQRWRFIGEVASGLLVLGQAADRQAAGGEDAPHEAGARQPDRNAQEMFRFFLTHAVEDIVPMIADPDPDPARLEAEAGTACRDLVWKINLNRSFRLAVNESARTVKADAARRLFDHDPAGIVWAVVDSGVDASHVAFARRKDGAVEEAWYDTAWPVPSGDFSRLTRVIASYDFRRLDDFMSARFDRLIEGDGAAAATADLLAAPPPAGPGWPRGKAITAALVLRRRFPDILRQILAAPAAGAAAAIPATALAELRDHVEQLDRRVLTRREIDWPLLEPVIAIPHDGSYRRPAHPHGTHVAGILCASQRTSDSRGGLQVRDLTGLCPDLEIFDLRVSGPDGGGDEFTVLSALQFIQHLNRDRGRMRVQGVNLSLSLEHDVRSFACGRTPICMEAERLVAGGVVVVAAAGNYGMSDRMTASGSRRAGYDAMSISDPGNAEAVITVGATHRSEPHAYGVSYFSSRGPTGDGRQKPDLVAPGEKILSTVPGNRLDVMDGTSMAAPHVSGGAAILMARNRELIRRPGLVKRILCESATDLGRERRFQGAGLLDILRALQTV
ncbi:S8 family serine peptidase [Albidovulum sp.]